MNIRNFKCKWLEYEKNIWIFKRIEYETNIIILKRIKLLFIYSFTSLVCTSVSTTERNIFNFNSWIVFKINGYYI